METEQLTTAESWVDEVLQKIVAGEAPVELSNLFASLGPTDFAVWLSGLTTGLAEPLASSEMTRWLRHDLKTLETMRRS